MLEMNDAPGIGRMYQLATAATALDHPAASMTSIGGSRDQVAATARVIAATQDLSSCLASDSPSLSQVMSSIDRKNVAAGEFLRCTGTPWPL